MGRIWCPKKITVLTSVNNGNVIGRRSKRVKQQMTGSRVAPEKREFPARLALQKGGKTMIGEIRGLLARRKLIRYLENCNFELAQDMLNKKLNGTIIPTNLAKLLHDFDAKPCPETALMLIRFDEKFMATFELAQKGGMFEWAFMESKKKKG